VLEDVPPTAALGCSKLDHWGLSLMTPLKPRSSPALEDIEMPLFLPGKRLAPKTEFF
jgi:hypothetical protein